MPSDLKKTLDTLAEKEKKELEIDFLKKESKNINLSNKDRELWIAQRKHVIIFLYIFTSLWCVCIFWLSYLLIKCCKDIWIIIPMLSITATIIISLCIAIVRSIFPKTPDIKDTISFSKKEILKLLLKDKKEKQEVTEQRKDT